MGGAILQALSDEPRAALTAAITAPNSPNIGKDAGEVVGLQSCGVKLSSDIRAALSNCDVLIDFSSPKAAIDAALSMHGTRCHTLVTGTTGYTETERKALLAAGNNITLLKSGNFSLGVNMLEALVELAADKLREGWDIEVLEMHHKHKVDAPDARVEGQIGFAALRGGGVIGAHEVRLANELEMITLSHDAFDRSVFAKGAVAAAIWAAEQTKGVYDMKDVLGLKA